MDESALVWRAQKGDVNSYNTLVLHYQEQAFNVAYRIMGETDSAPWTVTTQGRTGARSPMSTTTGSANPW